MDINEIVPKINNLVVEYIEGKIKISDFRNGISEYDRTDIFDKLKVRGETEIISIIDIGSDILFSSSRDYSDPNDSSSAQKILERYYEKIKI